MNLTMRLFLMEIFPDLSDYLSQIAEIAPLLAVKLNKKLISQRIIHGLTRTSLRKNNDFAGQYCRSNH